MRVPNDMKVPVLLTIWVIETAAIALLSGAGAIIFYAVAVLMAAWVAFA